MNETPEMITPKDLLYIEDMMNFNFNMYKKLEAYLDCVDNEDTADILNKAKKMHKKHFGTLLSILK